MIYRYLEYLGQKEDNFVKKKSGVATTTAILRDLIGRKSLIDEIFEFEAKKRQNNGLTLETDQNLRFDLKELIEIIESEYSAPKFKDKYNVADVNSSLDASNFMRYLGINVVNIKFLYNLKNYNKILFNTVQ